MRSLSRFLLPLPLVLASCTGDTPADSGPGDDTGADLVVVDGHTRAEDPSVSAARTTDMTLGLTVSGVLAEILQDTEAQDYVEDGEVTLTGVLPPDGCVSRAVEEGALVLDYSACPHVQGTVRLDFVLGGPLSVVFSEDFSWRGVSLSGTLELSAQVRAGEYSIAGDLVVQAATVEVSLGMVVAGPEISLVGALAVDGETAEGLPVSTAVLLGTADVPLRWLGGCRCPAEGDLVVEIGAEISEVTLDLDVLIAPTDGSDDYPPMAVPIVPVTAALSATVTFTETCGGQSLELAAEDVTLTAATADLSALLAESCDAGEIDTRDCVVAEAALAALGETVSVDVPAEALVAASEPLAQAALDTLCPQ